MRLKEAADPGALLAQEQERRREAERRLAAHAARAAENNTALARKNLRLQEQLARLRGEADALAHEAGCQRAAAAARELLAAEELGRLRGRLQRAEAEQQALRKQLAAKQGIISYLESKLERLQDRDNQPSLGAGAVAAAVVERTDVASTGAAPVAGRDEAVLVSDSSSRSSLTVGDWAAAAAELEAQELPYTAAVAAGGEGGSVRGSGSDGGSEYGEGLGQGLGAAAPSVWRSNGKAQAGKARVRVAAFAAHTYEQPAVVAVAAAAADLEAVQEDALASDGGDSALIVPLAVTPAAAVAEEATPARRPSRPGAEASFEPSGTAPRSSLRARSSGVSYAEPSLRSKLRQGDPHTFGMVPASAAQQQASAQPHARTKPRPLFAAFRKAGPGQALQPVSD